MKILATAALAAAVLAHPFLDADWSAEERQRYNALGVAARKLEAAIAAEDAVLTELRDARVAAFAELDELVGGEHSELSSFLMKQAAAKSDDVEAWIDASREAYEITVYRVLDPDSTSGPYTVLAEAKARECDELNKSVEEASRRLEEFQRRILECATRRIQHAYYLGLPGEDL